MIEDDTQDLTADEKLSRILADLGDVKARLTALEAQSTGATRPLLDRIIQETITTRETLAERIDSVEKELTEVRRDLRSIDRKFDILNREIFAMKADSQEHADRLAELERRPN